MPVNAIAFLVGVCALQLCRELPPAASFFILCPVVPLLKWRRTRWLAIATIGFFWAAFRADLALDTELAPSLEGQTVLVEGRLLDVPQQQSARKARFLFRVEQMDAGDGWRPFPARLRLSLYDSQLKPASGERWLFAVRLKRPHGFANPGGFDYERWLLQQRIRATGYIRNDERNTRIDPAASGPVNALRDRLVVALGEAASASPSLGLILAVTTGSRTAIDEAQWHILRSTGTAHLVAISGLHVSLVAGLVFMLARRGWLLSGRLAAQYPADRVAALVAIAAAILYAQLAGFGIPTQRAVVMLAAGMLAMLSGRYAGFPGVIGLAVFATLVFDPLSVLSAGWWLSFWAVVTIAWLVTGRHGRVPAWQKWLGMHVVLALSMLPLLLVFFQQASLAAPLGNFIAVPWVSLLVVPVSLLGTLAFTVHEGVGMRVFDFAGDLVALVWPWLEWLSALPHALLSTHQPLPWTLLPAIVGLAVLFMPRGLPGRLTGVALMLPLLFSRPTAPAEGGFLMMQLDVGQGLATVLQTRHHVLVYDAGPRFSDRFDTGSAVVVPYLRSRGIRSIDGLVVSHDDNDHIGGVLAVLKAVPARRVVSGMPGSLPPGQADRCEAGAAWEWDGVQFSVLYPQPGDPQAGNNASCVVRVESAFGHSVLLTGDIEAFAERQLLASYPGELAADVLVAPHHGSLTSSTEGLVQAVSPSVTLFPAGYRNRYGFPRPEVIERYRAIGSRLFHTGHDGAVRVESTPGRLEIRRYRQDARRYWNEPPRAVWLPR